MGKKSKCSKIDKKSKVAQDNLDLWNRAEKGDLKSHLILGYKYGLYTKEDLDWFRRMENEEKEE
jgi:hypothetical protein